VSHFIAIILNGFIAECHYTDCRGALPSPSNIHHRMLTIKVESNVESILFNQQNNMGRFRSTKELLKLESPESGSAIAFRL
jgi:hypothetical protein